jgi:hypothetical protein
VEWRQVEWRPLSLEELVRTIIACVRSGVCRRLGPVRVAQPDHFEGRPGHPTAAILLALWLFATIEGVASGRQVARLCGEHIAYRWRCG